MYTRFTENIDLPSEIYIIHVILIGFMELILNNIYVLCNLVKQKKYRKYKMIRGSRNLPISSELAQTLNRQG